MTRLIPYLLTLSLLTTPTDPPTEKQNQDRNARIARTQVPWVENAGQWDEDLLFVANTFTGNVLVNAEREIVYALPVDSTSGYVLKERFVGVAGKQGVRPVGEQRKSSVSNYFIGNDPAQWTTGVASYEMLNLGEVWDGIKVKLNAYNSNVEKLFYVQPQVDPQAIRIAVDGAEDLSLTPDGQLLVHTPAGKIAYSAPVAYQWIDGEKIFAKAYYQIDATEANTYSFRVADYDPDYELIIDPYLASTFMGDGGNDWGTAIATDEAGNVFVTGYSWSDNFPTTAGSFDEGYNGVKEAYVAKLTNDLSEVLVSSYLGGSSWDNGLSIAMEDNGQVIISGATGSADFPMAGASYDNGYNGGSNDVFVVKMDNDLSQIIASTYLGGSTDEGADAIVTDEAGNVFVSGFTYSADFPYAGVAYDSIHNGSGDIFVAKFNNNLNMLTAATFIGGTNFEESHAIALDESQNVFIAGYTGSPEYPSTPGVYDEIHNANHDAIITKLDNDLTTILASTFIGGADDDDTYGLVIEGAENVFITGITFSTDYPTTPNASFDTHGGRRDIFLSRFTFDLSELLESTYLGGGDNDWALDLTIDNAGSVFIGGGTYSGDFPMVGSPYDDTHNGGEDVVIAKIVGCGVNDFCDPENAFGSIYLDVSRETVCLEGCSATAGPGPMIEGGCFNFPHATVWYTFTPETDGDCIQISITSDDLPQPQMAVFQGACPGSAMSLPFACDAGTGGQLDLRMGVEAGETYYIAVSDATGAEGYYDICIENNPEEALSLEVDAQNVQCFESNNGTIAITAVNGTGYIDYDWNHDMLDGMPDASGLAIGMYQVTVTDENFCVATTDSIILTQPDQLFVDLELGETMDNNTILYGDTLLVRAVPSIIDEAITRVTWSPGEVLADGPTDRITEQHVSPRQVTELVVTIEDTLGCTVSDSVFILISDEFPFYVPNAFAPTSQNESNRTFRPFVTNKVQEIPVLRIFNRWGALVYERYDFPVRNESAGWDGTVNGQVLDPGVYMYAMELEFVNGDRRMYSGEVTLIR
jgi:gliding motility-associated-like protein